MERNTISDRLEKAIRTINGHDVRWFQEQISERYTPEGRREKPGTSYQTVLAYVNGDRTPGVGFLRAAARVLEVRPAWLILGEGPAREPGKIPEEEEEQIRLAVQAAMLRGAEAWAESPDTVEHQAETVTRRLLAACPDGDHSFQEVRLAADAVSRLVLTPIRTLSNLDMSAGQAWERYCIAALHALELAIPEAGEGRPLEEIVGALEDGSAIPPATISLSE